MHPILQCMKLRKAKKDILSKENSFCENFCLAALEKSKDKSVCFQAQPEDTEKRSTKAGQDTKPIPDVSILVPVFGLCYNPERIIKESSVLLVRPE